MFVVTRRPCASRAPRACTGCDTYTAHAVKYDQVRFGGPAEGLARHSVGSRAREARGNMANERAPRLRQSATREHRNAPHNRSPSAIINGAGTGSRFSPAGRAPIRPGPHPRPPLTGSGWQLRALDRLGLRTSALQGAHDVALPEPMCWRRLRGGQGGATTGRAAANRAGRNLIRQDVVVTVRKRIGALHNR